MGKVIDLMSRLKVQNTSVSKEAEPTPFSYRNFSAAPVVDYSSQKQKILFHERRHIKRTILTEFVSAMVVIPEKGLLKVALYDISEKGISFDVEDTQGAFKLGEEVSMRVYMNQKTYFPISVKIKYVKHDKTEAVIRHGTLFMQDSATDAALRYFVRFIEAVSGKLKTDEGDLMAPKIS